MRKLLLTSVAVASLAGSTAHAVVTVQADDNVGISFQADVNAANNNVAVRSNPTLKTAVQNGDDLLVGNRILVGYFTVSDAQIQAHSTDVGYLTDPNIFKQYGTNADQPTIGDSYPGKNGHFSDVVNTGNADTQGLVGKQIYLFVLGSTDNSTFAKSIGTAFQLGVFYFDATLDSDWKFASESGVPNNTIIDFSDLTVNNAGAVLSPSAHVVLGGFGPDVSNTTGATDFRLTAIPEPGTAALALFGGAALLLRRRRD